MDSYILQSVYTIGGMINWSNSFSVVWECLFELRSDKNYLIQNDNVQFDKH